MTSSKEVVGIGLVGCGARLRGIVRRLLEEGGGRVKVVALCDPSEKSIATAREVLAAPEARVYADAAALAADPQVAWVMIGSWNRYHREHAEAALAAGKDVFCEKPLATHLEDCIALRDAWRRSGKRFFLGFTLRYSPLYRRVREIVQSGELGELISLEFNETLAFNHGGYIHQDWRRLRENAGTHLLEKCCHDFDIIDSLVQSPVRYAASFGGCDFFKPEHAHHARRIGPDADGRPAFEGWLRHLGQREGVPESSPFRADKDIVDNQVAILQYQNGVRASFHTNCSSALPERRVYLQGTEGSLRADALAMRIEYQRIGWDTERKIIELDVKGGHGGSDAVLAGQLAQCVLHGAEPVTGIMEGLRAAVNCFGVDQALDEGRVVDLAPMWEAVGLPVTGDVSTGALAAAAV